jgi:hypothetical protein
MLISLVDDKADRRNRADELAREPIGHFWCLSPQQPQPRRYPERTGSLNAWDETRRMLETGSGGGFDTIQCREVAIARSEKENMPLFVWE